MTVVRNVEITIKLLSEIDLNDELIGNWNALAGKGPG